MSGFGNCCDFRKSHLLCDLPKGLTGKSQVYAVELVLLEYFVSSIKTLRECLVQVILSWKAYSALRDCGFLICFRPTLSINLVCGTKRGHLSLASLKIVNYKAILRTSPVNGTCQYCP